MGILRSAEAAKNTTSAPELLGIIFGDCSAAVNDIKLRAVYMN